MFHGVQLSSINTSSCRVCLKNDDKNGILLDQNCEILKLFEFCTNLYILPQDNARMICTKCVQKIKTYAKFKKKCLEASEIWKLFRVHNEKQFPQTYSELRKLISVVQDDKTQNLSPSDITNEKCVDVKTEVLDADLINRDGSYIKGDSDINALKTEGVDIKDGNENSCTIDNLLNEEFLDEACKDEDEYMDIPEPMKPVNYKHVKVKKQIHRIKRLKQNDVNKPKTPVQRAVINFCGICNYSSANSEDNRNHLGKHWSNNDLKCNICEFTGQDSADLFTHRYTHYPNSRSIKFYFCHICEKKCASSYSLEFHYRSMHLQKPGGFCSQCRKTFSVYSTWKKHERLHRSERFICDHCGKKFLYRNQIEGHLIDHGDARNFMCEACGKSFKRKFGLKIHLRAVHSSEAIKCTHCDKVFKSQITYNEHMKVVRAEKPFVCVHCGKSYHLESALRSHMFWHTGERPHICDVCGLKYKSKGQLKVHKRNHTGYMPFKCRECDKCFTSSQPLKRHQSVHTGKRAHKCGYCDRTFHEKKSLVEHCSSTHKDKANVKLEDT